MADVVEGEVPSIEGPQESGTTGSSYDLQEPKWVPIASSESYDFEDVGRFLARTDATVVTLLGDRDSGKSTLICSIYDRFLHGPFARLSSAGSLTITGLEQRVHYERVESGRDVPDTQHTSLAEGLRYFHFCTCDEKSSEEARDLLISDRAGELYKNARGNPALESSLIELRVADYLVVMLDGARVANINKQASALFAVRQTLQMLADRQPTFAKYQIQIVITKIDLIETAENAEELRTTLEEFRARLLATFGTRFAGLSFFETAARAEQGEYERAHGVASLLQSWMLGPTSRQIAPAGLTSPVTEFDLFAKRALSSSEASK